MFISIVIPTYNRAAFIKKTINSLLDQTVRDFEILVIDDGSTDDTVSVMGSIKDQRVRFYQKENAERAAARNYGARLATGDYINFFDSDDLAYTNHVAEAVAAIQSLNFPEVFHLGYDIKDASGKLLGLRKRWPRTINQRLIDGNHLSCNGVFVRRDIALQHPFNELRELSASEDYELWLRLAARFPFHCRSVVTSSVINHDTRSVLTINREKFLQRMKLLETELLKDPEFMSVYGEELRTFRAYRSIYIALHLAMARTGKAESISYLRHAILNKPTCFMGRRFLGAVKNLILH